MSNKLFVGALAWATDQESLKNHFAPFGEVLEAQVILDRYSGRSRGFGFVTFETEEEAKKAVEALDGTELDGRTIHVNEARERTPRSEGGGGGGFRGRDGNRGGGGGFRGRDGNRGGRGGGGGYRGREGGGNRGGYGDR